MKRTLSRYVSEYEMGDETVGLFNSVFLTKKFIKKDSWIRSKNSTDFSEIPAEEVETLEDGKMILEEGEDDKRLNEFRAGRAVTRLSR